MTREEIHKNILNGLLNCTDEFGERIADRYTSSQMNDFANTITAFFPSNLEYKLNLLESEIFENIPDKEIVVLQHLKFVTQNLYLRLVEKLNINHIDTQVDKEELMKMMFHIFFFSGKYLKDNNETDIDKLYHQCIAFYNSFKINNFDLNREIEKDITREQSYTIPINQEESIRVQVLLNEIKLIPTRKTKEQFKNLILWT